MAFPFGVNCETKKSGDKKKKRKTKVENLPKKFQKIVTLFKMNVLYNVYIFLLLISSR